MQQEQRWSPPQHFCRHRTLYGFFAGAGARICAMPLLLLHIIWWRRYVCSWADIVFNLQENEEPMSLRLQTTRLEVYDDKDMKTFCDALKEAGLWSEEMQICEYAGNARHAIQWGRSRQALNTMAFHWIWSFLQPNTVNEAVSPADCPPCDFFFFFCLTPSQFFFTFLQQNKQKKYRVVLFLVCLLASIWIILDFYYFCRKRGVVATW